MVEQSKNATVDLNSYFTELDRNSTRKELRLAAKNEAKENFMREQLKYKKESDDKKIKILQDEVKIKCNNQRVHIITKKIEMARNDVISFCDIPELKDDALKRLRVYYKEMDDLTVN